MDFPFIQKWIDKEIITPAQWRLIETSIVCAWTYITGAVMEWKALSLNGLMVAIVTPLYLYLSKKKRDLSDKS